MGLALAVRGNDAAPGTGGLFMNGFGSPDVFSFSAAGAVAFSQSYTANESFGSGAWAGPLGALQLIATNIMPVPVALSAYGLNLDPARFLLGTWLDSTTELELRPAGSRRPHPSCLADRNPEKRCGIP